MKLTNQQISYVYAKNLVSELLNAGVSGFCVSPGFRNSPLVLAARMGAGDLVFSHVDERGAAFFALGLAKASGKPAVLICTSGTAAANYFPAILEAYYANIPLIVVTADRPYEMVGVGANQSMQQVGLYGSHVRMHIDIPPPSENAECRRHLQFSARRLYSVAKGPSAGPVHLNISFREPFLASEAEIEAIAPEYFISSDITIFTEPQFGSEGFSALVLDRLKKAKRPCLSFGPGEFSAETKQLALAFSAKFNIPIFAEPSSGLACTPGATLSNSLFLRFDHFLRSPHFSKELWPDLVIRLGPPLTSKFWGLLLEKSAAPQVIFDVPGEAKNPQLGPSIFCGSSANDAISWLSSKSSNLQIDVEWVGALQELENQTEAALTDHLLDKTAFTEWSWMRDVSQYLAGGANIFLGNSMPIRDWDSVFPKTNFEHRIYCNRGLSGIDGILSSAIGVAVASKSPTHLFVGDLTALHDINALTLAKRLQDQLRLTIWIHNNQGGEIFRIVPTSTTRAPAEWFTTPQQVEFAALAKAFHLSYFRANSISDLDGLDATGLAATGVRIIELVFPGEVNTEMRKKFWKKFQS